MEQRGRGAKGRARGGAVPPGQQQPARQAPRPGPQQPQQAWGGRPGGPPPAQAQGAWARAPPQQPAPAAAPQQWQRPPVPETSTATPSMTNVGRGSRAGGGDETAVSTQGPQVTRGGGDNGGNGERRGHGGVRGRTNRYEVINTRPTHVDSKKGVDGSPIQLIANFFPLEKATSWGLNHYRIDFSPEVDDTRVKKGLVRTALAGHNIQACLCDGNDLFTTARLLPEPLELFANNRAGEPIRLTFKLTGDLAWGDYHYLQLFNIIIRKCLAFMGFELIGRNYFDAKAKVVIKDHNLELLPGYFTSMRQFETDIMLNVDLCFKVARTDTVYDLMMDCRGQNARQDFARAIIGSTVLTYYNIKTYRIDDVDFSSSPSSTFKKRDGSSISYAQYFKEKYNLDISTTNQPMLVSRSKPREIRAGMPELVYLVPSLCVMTGLTDRQRENFHLMKDLGAYTRVAPQGRMKKLQDFSRRIQSCPEAVSEIKKWDLQLAKGLIDFTGRILPEETLFGRTGTKFPAGRQADWTRSLRSNPMFHAPALGDMAIIVPHKFSRAAEDFGNLVKKAAQGMSFNIVKYKSYIINDDRSQSYLDMLENVITRENPGLVMCVLPNNSADRYNSIKKKCYVDRAVPCQVMVSRNLTAKGVMSIATKVAIQICCKIGGSPWGTQMPKNTMIVGYDVCRDTANRKKSFAGIVASMDMSCTRYFSVAIEHEFEQEISANLGATLVVACNKYKEINGLFPERIVIYRDGVGDGQIPYVREHEVEMTKKALCDQIYRNGPPKMAFIIVSKRINVKMFRHQPFMVEGRPDFNPPPGTVVDDVITLPERYDFYIISQCVHQGTVSPTSYNVIDDSLGIDPNKIQRFTYKMTHMYFNWSGTVRVPAPCQYAHKLAFLTAQSLHRPANRGLANVLYYL